VLIVSEAERLTLLMVLTLAQRRRLPELSCVAFQKNKFGTKNSGLW